MRTLLLLLAMTGSLLAADEKKTETIIVGGGCFWCTEGAYKLVPGVTKVVSGYTAGKTENPTYEDICTGESGHAEVVKVEFDPAIVGYKDILDLFFDMHDPTTITKEPMMIHGKLAPAGTPYQGNDYGTQYRSIIVYETDAQKALAEQAKKDAASHYPDPIVTEVVALKKFYPAEDYHQDYFKLNPNQGYCRMVVGPKLKKFKEKLEARKAAAKP
jgi:peptide-methionine (S)-S-oxide reductase